MNIGEYAIINCTINVRLVKTMTIDALITTSIWLVERHLKAELHTLRCFYIPSHPTLRALHKTALHICENKEMNTVPVRTNNGMLRKHT